MRSGSAGQSGTVTIGGRNIPIIVDPCPSSPTGVTPTTLTFTSAAGSRNVTVAGLTGCSWPVTDNQPWITTPSTVSAGTMTVRVGENTGSTTRSGTVTIGTSRTVAVSQLPPTCPGSPTSVSPTSLSFTSAAGMQNVTVTGPSGCRWPVIDNQGWITTLSTVTAGTMTVRVGENTGSTTRSGTVTIGLSRTVAVSQLPPTTPCPSSPTSVSPMSLSFTSAAGMQNVTVTGPSGCRWPVIDNQGWITTLSTVTAGTMTVRVGENTGSTTRSGTVTIGLSPYRCCQPVSLPPPVLGRRPVCRRRR